METHCKIVNVKYKNVIRGQKFSINKTQIEAKKCIDDLCAQINSEPTGYIIAIFGKDTNQGMARSYYFPKECPVGLWQAVNILKDSI
jgi:hypothetical protein